jgi:hypothetical protein
MKYCWVFFVFQEIKNQEIIIDHLKKKKKQSLKGKKNKKAVYFIGSREKKRKETKHRPTN